jgi:hypothetical protein
MERYSMKTINYFLILLLLTSILTFCTNKRTGTLPPPTSSYTPKPTEINYKKNKSDLLYYSKDNLNFEDILKNSQDIKVINTIDTRNMIINFAPPVFPDELRINKDLNETVVVKTHIDMQGKVESAIIEKSGGIHLDNNCIDAVLKSEFEISELGEDYILLIPYKFKLR